MRSGLSRLSSGVPGLDDILNGGLIENRLYLVSGLPGSGKSTFGMQFLEAGLKNGEDVLYIHGEESKEDSIANAAELGIDIADAEFLDFGPESEFFTQSDTYDIVHPEDIEDSPLIDIVRESIGNRNPTRVLIDPIDQLHYLERDEFQARKRIIAFSRFIKDHESTVVGTKTPDNQFGGGLRSLCDGVITLSHGEGGRRITIDKHRGVGQVDGSHGVEIQPGGIEVFPRIHPENQDRTLNPTKLRSGIENLDRLLGGGIEQGTVTIISGPSGVGKSTLSSYYLQAMAETGESVLTCLFEESKEMFRLRAETFGIPFSKLEDQELLHIEDIVPHQLSAEEFAHLLIRRLEEFDIRFLVIDGIEGYKTAIKSGGSDLDLRQRLHALTRYLNNRDITVLLIDEQHTVTGIQEPTGSRLSYIADNLIYQQYIESENELQRVVGVMKKRIGDFEKTPRKFSISGDGLVIGEPLGNIQGVLDGRPERTEDTDRS